jgi:hypothetical protein
VTRNREHAGIGRERACHDFDEGGFASAIFAHQRVNLAFTEFERYSLEGLDSGERFSDSGSFEKRHAGRQGITISRLNGQ